MSAAGSRNDVIAVRAIWPAVVLSLLVHLLALLLAWPHLAHLATADTDRDAQSALAVRIAPPNQRADATPPPLAAAPPPPPVQRARPVPPRRVLPVPAPRPTPQRPQAPPVIAQDAQPAAPVAPPQEPAPVAPPTVDVAPRPLPSQPSEPAPTDLAAYIESRRRARGEVPSMDAEQVAKADIARRDAIVAENLGLNRTPTFGYDPKSAGGLFQIRSVRYDDAEFFFLGMDRDIGRRAKQLIEVRRGDAPDIRVAVVRKMIEIIRDNVSGDFLWASQRLGRQVQLSARPADNATLEAFIYADVFPEGRAP